MTPNDWRTRIDQLMAEGADVIDIGGESSRPQAEPVSAEEQCNRVLGPIRYAVACGATVSIDTTHPYVAREALRAGASLLNDVSCLVDAALARVAQETGADLLIMHSRGSMTTMASYSNYPQSSYGDVVQDVIAELGQARARSEAAGLPQGAVCFDPGLGFHKNAEHSYTLLRRFEELHQLGAPLVVGPSRKSFLSYDVHAPPEARLGGTIAACLLAAQKGAAALRVHDVLAVRQALAVARRGGVLGEGRIE